MALNIPRYEWSFDRSARDFHRPEWEREFGLAPLWQQVLKSRGYGSRDQVEDLLDFGYDRLDEAAARLDGLEEVAAELLAARDAGEGVLVYSDYDADGICAAHIAFTALYRLGVPCNVFLPHRLEHGYGLHEEPLRRAGQRGYKHVLALDVGTSDTDVIERVSGELEVYVLDHHKPGETLPDTWFVNPVLQEDEDFAPCAAGLALLLARELAEQDGADVEKITRDLLPLAAVATIGDVVKLSGINRVIARRGMELLHRMSDDELNPGLAALREETGLNGGGELTAWQIAMRIVPRLNAAGRMAHPGEALSVLSSDDLKQARSRASNLENFNTYRRDEQDKVEKKAMSRMSEVYTGMDPAVVALAGEDWHYGVVGIVASRLVRTAKRPVLLLTKHGAAEGELHGSGRSHGGVDLKQVLDEVADEAGLIRWGGHKEACGLTLPEENLKTLRLALDESPAAHDRREQETAQVEGYIDATTDERELLRGYRELKPFGEGFPQPTVMLSSAKVKETKLVGSDNTHLSAQVEVDGKPFRLIGFRKSHLKEALDSEPSWDILCRLGYNYFRGRSEVQLRLHDIRPTDHF